MTLAIIVWALAGTVVPALVLRAVARRRRNHNA